jgi:ADP-ribose pyrophosphatase YjhB (NUDIX family)
MKFKEPDSHIHLIVRGLIIQGENIILCHIKGAHYFFLPGGHVENGESVETALLREFNEEMEGSEYEISSFIGACENIFLLKEDIRQHEMNIILKVVVPENIELKSKEDHLEFVSVKKDDFKNQTVFPEKIKEGIIDWFDNGKTFFKEIEK